MTTLLAVDGPIYRVLGGWVSLVRSSATWLVLCLPLVTAPAATVVLLRTLNAIAAGHAAPGFAESWRLVRQSLWPALRLGAVLLAGSAVVVSALLGPTPQGIWESTLPMVVIPVAVSWALVSTWSLAVLEERGDGVWAALRYAYLRAMRRPELAAVCLAATVGLPALGFIIPTTIWLPYWLTAPAVWAWVATVTCRRAGVTARMTSNA